MAAHGIPYPEILVWGAVAVEIGGAAYVDRGCFCALGRTRIVLLYTRTRGNFPRILGCSAGRGATDASFCFGHLSMMGGMLYVVAFGATASIPCGNRKGRVPCGKQLDEPMPC
jgi:hypothetical protein